MHTVIVEVTAAIAIRSELSAGDDLEQVNGGVDAVATTITGTEAGVAPAIRIASGIPEADIGGSNDMAGRIGITFLEAYTTNGDRKGHCNRDIYRSQIASHGLTVDIDDTATRAVEVDRASGIDISG